ncbi:MAG: hypothetical protein V8Q16_03345 [Akkermansia muciniphila]
MRSFFGSILLILVLAALGATIYYHWSTNSHLEFELRNPDEPEKTIQVINMEKRAAALQAVPGKNSSFPRGRNSRFRCRNAGTRGIIIPPVAAL